MTDTVYLVLHGERKKSEREWTAGVLKKKKKKKIKNTQEVKENAY